MSLAAPDPNSENASAARPDRAAEAQRRACTRHAIAVKVVGVLFLATAVVTTVLAVLCGVMAVQTEGAHEYGELVHLAVSIGFLVFSASAAACFLLGFGLLRLRPWARWALGVLSAVALAADVGSLVGSADRVGSTEILSACVLGIVPVVFLFLVLSPWASVVFSREYRNTVGSP